METIFEFLHSHRTVLEYAWWISLGGMVLLYLITNFVPARIVGRLLPLHIVFEPRRNLDLDFQSLGYALLHKSWFSRITHYSIFIDAFFWFIVFNFWHWSVGAGILALMIVQSLLIGDRKFLVSFTLAGSAVYASSFAIGNALGWENAYLLAITGLMFGGFIRFVGHTIEPIPPMVLDESDQFVPLTPKTFNWKIVVLVLVGYIAEFSSSLPNRLFAVQVNYLYQFLLRLKPETTTQWKELEARSTMAFRGGYSKVKELHEYYLEVKS